MKHQSRQTLLSFIKKLFVVIFLTGVSILGISKHATSQKNYGMEELLQEFFIAKPVYAQHRHEVQLTVKPNYWRPQGSEITSIPLQVEYGFTDKFQVELELPYDFNHSISGERLRGIGKAELGFLYNILKGNNPFALSLAMDIGLPTERREKGVEKRTVTWGPSLIAAKQIGTAQVHVSVGAELCCGQSALNYNLASVLPFGVWRATLELNGESDDENLLYLTPGLIWKGLDDFEFGLGIPKSLNKNSSSWGMILMITHEFSLTRQDKQHD
jgi:hypothetical protein